MTSTPWLLVLGMSCFIQVASSPSAFAAEDMVSAETPQETSSEVSGDSRSPASLSVPPKRTHRVPAKALPTTQQSTARRKTASTKTKSEIKEARFYEFGLSNDGERLTFEESVIDGRSAYFVERRRGKKKVLGVISVGKKDFERWTAEIDQVLTSRQKLDCAKAPKLYRRGNGKISSLYLCEGQLTEAQSKKLTALSTEILKLLKKPAAVKAAR